MAMINLNDFQVNLSISFRIFSLLQFKQISFNNKSTDSLQKYIQKKFILEQTITKIDRRMTSNKTTGRNTNQGYLSRQNLSLKNSFRSDHNTNGHKRTNSKRANQDEWNDSYHNSKQIKSNPYKNQEVPFIEQSQEEDSVYEYSFNKRPQNRENPNNPIANTNSKGAKPIPQVNANKQKKTSQQIKGKNVVVKLSQKETLNKRLPNDQSQKHTKTKSIPTTNSNNKQPNITQPIKKQQDKVQMLQWLLKQAHYQNQLLRQKLVISQGRYETINQEYELLQQNYKQLQQIYGKLEEKYAAQMLSQYKQVPKQSQMDFIAGCQEEMDRLKGLVKDLSEQKSILQLRQSPSERQEIKDRIIMKLQDQLITHKLLLQQAKLINTHNNKHNGANDMLLPNYNHNHQHNRSYQQSQRNPLQEISTNRTRYSPSQHKYNLSNHSANKHKLSYQ